MMLRLTLPAIALLYATGCCCCPTGGSSSSSSSGPSWRDKLEEEAAEAIAEKVLEAATGAEDIQIDENTGTIRMKTDEGEAVITGVDEGGTMTFKGADGSTMEVMAGSMGKLPDDFPFAAPPGSQVMVSNRTVAPDATIYMVMLQHPGGSEAALLAHWEAELGKLGTLKRSEIIQGDNRVVSLVVDGMRDTAVAVTTADGQLSSTLTARLPKN